MGAVKRDIHKKAREYDDLYEYNREGVALILRDIYRMENSRFAGDIDATGIIADLFMALDSDCLTPRMRQVVALYYFVGLTEIEASEFLDCTRVAVTVSKNSALTRISEHMYKGGKFKAGDPFEKLTEKSSIYVWLNDVAVGIAPIYEVPVKVFTDVLLATEGTDANAKETIRQRVEGLVFVDDYADEEEYLCMTDEQFRWADRRVSYVPEVFPPGDTIGTRKVAIKLRDDPFGREYIIEKRKLLKKRGN